MGSGAGECSTVDGAIEGKTLGERDPVDGAGRSSWPYNVLCTTAMC